MRACRRLIDPFLGRIRSLVTDSIRGVTLVVGKVSVGQTEVALTLAAHHRDELLLLAAAHRTLVRVDLARVRAAELVNVAADSDIRGHVLGRGHWLHAQRTHWHLHVLSQARGTVVAQVRVVVQAECGRTGVAAHGKEVYRGRLTMTGQYYCRCKQRVSQPNLRIRLPSLLQVVCEQCCPRCGSSMVSGIRFAQQ